MDCLCSSLLLNIDIQDIHLICTRFYANPAVSINKEHSSHPQSPLYHLPLK